MKAMYCSPQTLNKRNKFRKLYSEANTANTASLTYIHTHTSWLGYNKEMNEAGW